MIDPRSAGVLAATSVIDHEHPLVRDTTLQLIDGRSTPVDRMTTLFRWVRDEIAYDMAPDLSDRGSWRASDTIGRGWGFCQQKAVLLTAMARAAGVPAVLAYQSVIEHRLPDRFEVYLPEKRMRPHGLSAVWIDGRWQQLDPSLHREMCDRRGLQLVEWVPGENALLPQLDLAGQPHCTIEEDLGMYDDLPDHIVAATMALSFLHTEEFRSEVRGRGRSEFRSGE